MKRLLAAALLLVTGALASSFVQIQSVSATPISGPVSLAQPRTLKAVTKSDSTDTSGYCSKGFIVGTAGNVTAIGCDDGYDAGTAPVMKNLPSGAYVPGCYKRINAATTAADIVCLGGNG